MNVNGKNHWMWTFQTAAVTYLAAYKGRGKAVIDDIFPRGLPKTIQYQKLFDTFRWGACRAQGAHIPLPVPPRRTL